MSYSRFAASVLVAVGLSAMAAGCTVQPIRVPTFDTGLNYDAGPPDAYTPVDVGNDMGNDANYQDLGLSPDAACESATSHADLVRLPADIIWVIDNSGSMAAAIESVRTGLNDFATQLVASDLDYRMIVISARTGAYSICVPEPLAGPSCADSERFFQVDTNIASQQVLEQVLGTLAQSDGYRASDARGGPPWRQLLRDGATRTFVVVTDDNQRTCTLRGSGTCLATDPPLGDNFFEDFPGGGNPFNSTTLGPGILDPSYGALFTGYTFDAIYGYGSDTDPNVHCGIGSTPSPGQTYTALVQRTGGVRAKICDGAAAFGTFFDAIRDSVLSGAPIECSVAIPPPPMGMSFQAGRVNVAIRGATGTTGLPYALSLSQCDATRGGWYYDDPAHPTQILLCPVSCTQAQTEVVGPTTGLDVQFGCQSVLI